MRNNLIQLGRTIRAKRKALGMTLQQVADDAGITCGLVSKIENFRTVPSLPILLKLAAALEVTMADLVKDVQTDKDYSPYLLVTRADRQAVEREDSHGFGYQSLMAKEVGGISSFQSFVLTISPDAQRDAVTTDGDQFIYMLAGAIDFVIGEDTVSMGEGDALYFDGALPHVPVNASDGDAVLLVVYLVKGG